jgi:hypothetical protein
MQCDTTDATNDEFPLWAMKLIQQHKSVYKFDPYDDLALLNSISRIIDWFHYLKTADPPVYARMDRINFQQAAAATKQWHEALEAKQREEQVGEEAGAKTVLQFNNGFRWVQLTDEASLDTEGRRMGHCVGGYCEHVKSGRVAVFSLRDTKNNPHVTVEGRLPYSEKKAYSYIHSYSVEQIKGRGNKPPADKYIPMVNALVKDLNLFWGGGGERDMYGCWCSVSIMIVTVSVHS